MHRAAHEFAARATDWYHNLVAHPDVTVEAGTEIYPVTATPRTGEDRDQITPSRRGAIPASPITSR